MPSTCTHVLLEIVVIYSNIQTEVIVASEINQVTCTREMMLSAELSVTVHIVGSAKRVRKANIMTFAHSL